MNAYLPTLAQESPDVVSTRHELEDHDALRAETDVVDIDLVTDNPAAPLLPSYPQATSEHRKNLEAPTRQSWLGKRHAYRLWASL
jgi:hypothetical protein